MSTKLPEIGCYGDGANGHEHTRKRCAAALTAFAERAPREDANAALALAAELRGDMSDDASEEYDACDWLNEYVAHPSASWGWQDGDFGLWPSEEE